MSDFGFINSQESIDIILRGKKYSVITAGKGFPCIIICLGTPSFRTLSRNFSEMFQLYSSDMYWVEDNALGNRIEVTMDTIIDDIKELGDLLGLQKYFIFAHSAYGIIALEFAKKYPAKAAGIIMVGTPVNWNQRVIEENNAIFHKEAEQKRKAIDKERREKIAAEDLSQLDPASQWLREYVYRDSARYWYIPDFDCTNLWQGLILDKLLVRLFDEILPKIEVLNNLEKIETPIFLAAGKSDFDCCPWVWENVKNLPKNFKIQLFNESGHWPHYEEPKLFDNSVKNWLNEVKK